MTIRRSRSAGGRAPPASLGCASLRVLRTCYTAGHSTRTGAELLELLRSAGVEALADVRRFPSSRRHPQFNAPELTRALDAAGIRYVWLGESLGGRRRAPLPPERSPNAAWTTAAFRAYADAMQTPEFRAGLAALEELARERATAFLCAERLWWQCHRRLLADLLLVRGWKVVHLLDPGKQSEHELCEWARLGPDGELTYPALV